MDVFKPKKDEKTVVSKHDNKTNIGKHDRFEPNEESLSNIGLKYLSENISNSRLLHEEDQNFSLSVTPSISLNQGNINVITQEALVSTATVPLEESSYAIKDSVREGLHVREGATVSKPSAPDDQKALVCVKEFKTGMKQMQKTTQAQDETDESVTSEFNKNNEDLQSKVLPTGSPFHKVCGERIGAKESSNYKRIIHQISNPDQNIVHEKSPVKRASQLQVPEYQPQKKPEEEKGLIKSSSTLDAEPKAKLEELLKISHAKISTLDVPQHDLAKLKRDIYSRKNVKESVALINSKVCTASALEENKFNFSKDNSLEKHFLPKPVKQGFVSAKGDFSMCEKESNRSAQSSQITESDTKHKALPNKPRGPGGLENRSLKEEDGSPGSDTKQKALLSKLQEPGGSENRSLKGEDGSPGSDTKQKELLSKLQEPGGSENRSLKGEDGSPGSDKKQKALLSKLQEPGGLENRSLKEEDGSDGIQPKVLHRAMKSTVASMRESKSHSSKRSFDEGRSDLEGTKENQVVQHAQAKQKMKADIEVTVCDYSESSTLNDKKDPDVENAVSDVSERRMCQLSPLSRMREQREIEKLTSASWHGTFIMEHDHHSEDDDWGASDESITFIFMTPGEEEDTQPNGNTLHDSFSQAACSNYESSSDLSHLGLAIGVPNDAQQVHLYDLYKTNCRRLIRTTSLDSISCALQKLHVSKSKAELQRTCSLEEMTRELADILERGRLFSSMDSIREDLQDEEAVMINNQELQSRINDHRRPTDQQEEKERKKNDTKSFNSKLNRQAVMCSSSEDDVFAKSPSPILTYGQTSWGDLKNMILGRSVSPSSMKRRRMSGETSKSSPQLHRRSSAESLSKKSVSWTDLQGCGALEIEVSESGAVKETSRPILHIKSIMKKPNLAPIAPTPPPSATPPISPPQLVPIIDPVYSENNSLVRENSDEDDMPLPRSNLREMFSLQLPPHIRERSLITTGSSSENRPFSLTLNSSPSRNTEKDQFVLKTSKTPQTSGHAKYFVDSKINIIPSSASNISESFCDAEYAYNLSSGSAESHFTSSRTAISPYYVSSDTAKSESQVYKYPDRLTTSFSNSEPSVFSLSSDANISSAASSSSPGGSPPISDSTTYEASDFDINIGNVSTSVVMHKISKNNKKHTIKDKSSLSSSTPSDIVPESLLSSSPAAGTVSAPTTTTPADESVPSLIMSKNNNPRYKSEGDLTSGGGGEGISDTWVTLSRVMQEAGTILKTLSETSLVLHHQIGSPDQRGGSLPPVLEENTANNIVSITDSNKSVASVAVQTDHPHATTTLPTRSTVAQTSFESSSDTENADNRSRLSYFQSKLLSHKSTQRSYVVPEGRSIAGSKGTSVLKELNRLRQERERMNSVLRQYDHSTLHVPQNMNRAMHKSCSSSDLDSPISSLMTSLQNLPQTQHHERREIEGELYNQHHHLSATSQRYLTMYQRRLQESCHQLEERLRFSARKRKLRSRLLSNTHNHFHTDAAKMALHASLDFAKSPFCDQPESSNSTPYMSTASLPTITPQSPIHTRDISPCCCISPTHQSRQSHLCSPARTCSAHTHWASCHAAPGPDMSYTPHCMTARVRLSSQQCRDQLLHLRRQLVSTSGLASSSSSLGDSPPRRGSHRLRGMGNILDTPYQRDHAASLSSLNVSSNPRAWRRNVAGSAASVASEIEADRRWPRRRLDSDSDSGAGWSSSGTSLRHTYQ